jgi:2-polyprenyl-6-methoxyphenol hydroxylase-like FAD-dependent oxidoreductase
MIQHKPISIIGGGLAGLTLGISLRQHSVPVTIYEAGRYPRHRVCGEFISGRGQEVLTRLGLRERLNSAGTIPAETAAFLFGKTCSPIRKLTPPAWSISRYALDTLLAHEFRTAGGDLLENSRWQAADQIEGVVDASGRHARPIENGWRWFGIKVHARAVRLSADLEMHGLPDGYVGMSRLVGGEVNVCGLFRRRVGNKAPSDWHLILRGSRGSALRERLGTAAFDEDSFCAVAGLPIRAQHAQGREECCIGDALTMIPPVTGNGMSMAFEAAQLATEPVAAYSRGECDWRETKRIIARACDKAFAQRLAWARRLQWLMFSPLMCSPAIGVVLNSAWLWKVMFSRTR